MFIIMNIMYYTRFSSFLVDILCYHLQQIHKKKVLDRIRAFDVLIIDWQTHHICKVQRKWFEHDAKKMYIFLLWGCINAFECSRCIIQWDRQHNLYVASYVNICWALRKHSHPSNWVCVLMQIHKNLLVNLT
jgi:hypothetical protein